MTMTKTSLAILIRESRAERARIQALAGPQ